MHFRHSVTIIRNTPVKIVGWIYTKTFFERNRYKEGLERLCGKHRGTQSHSAQRVFGQRPAATITSKNPLLAQSQKWHALAQSHKKSKSARSVLLPGKSQGEPPIFGVRLESVPWEKRAGYSVCCPHLRSRTGYRDKYNDSAERWQTAMMCCWEGSVDDRLSCFFFQL